MAEWVETNVNGYNVYTYDGNDWAAINKTYTYWGDAPVGNDWYVYTDSTNTVIMGLTAKLTNRVCFKFCVNSKNRCNFSGTESKFSVLIL